MYKIALVLLCLANHYETNEVIESQDTVLQKTITFDDINIDENVQEVEM